MTYTEFYVQTTGSNLNAGSTSADTAAFTYASGTWVQSTGVFTVASGNPSSDGVAVGDFASVYPDGSTTAVFIGRVTARDATTITVSLLAKSGTAPVDGSNNRTLKIGGAWKGPNGTEGFPFNFIESVLVNISENPYRVNFKSGVNYDITATITHGKNGRGIFSGYTSSIGDEGMATIDGGTSGDSFQILSLSGSYIHIENFILKNNGATGTAHALVITGSRNTIRNCKAQDIRHSGFVNGGVSNSFVECFAFRCNQAQDPSRGGISHLTNVAFIKRCVAQECSGSAGFLINNGECIMDNCISTRNGLDGISLGGSSNINVNIYACDIYGNSGNAINIVNTLSGAINVESCNFIANSGWGVNLSGSGKIIGQISNCGFGSGNQANTSGQIMSSLNLTTKNNVTYPENVTPWINPNSNNFNIVLSQAKSVGRGAFPITGAVGYPDIGAAQHGDTIRAVVPYIRIFN